MPLFNGIVETIGIVESRRGGGASCLRLALRAGEGWFEALPLGASVAVNGCCLTLVERDRRCGAFDVIPETVRNSNLGDLRVGEGVNLERALRVGDRIDGHFLQGHVDGVGVVESFDHSAGECCIGVRVPVALSRYIVRKGAIAVDGVSLTVVHARPGSFSVALIPATLERTVLGRRTAGARVNIETDILARQVVARLEAMLGESAGGGITHGRLREAGFLP